MSANVDLLRRTLAHIEANPDTWHQGHWACKTKCGTAYCFAGWAVMLTHPDAYPDFADGDWDVSDDIVIDGQLRDIECLATELLGLTVNESDALFGACNNLHDVRRIVGELTAEVSA